MPIKSIGIYYKKGGSFMNSILKKTVAIVLAVIMLTSVMSTAVFAVEIPSQEGCTELSLDEQITANIMEGEQYAWFAFTPEESGNYTFESFADELDPEVNIFDSEGNDVNYEGGDDHGSSNNFRKTAFLYAYETYYLRTWIYDNAFLNECEIPVMVTKVIYDDLGIENIDIDPVTIKAFSDGYFSWDDNDNRYFHYTYPELLSCQVKFADSEEIETYDINYSYTAEYDDVYYYIDIDGTELEIRFEDNQRSNHWYSGKTYDVTAWICDFEIPTSITVADPEFKTLDLNQPKIIEESDPTLLKFTPSTTDFYAFESSFYDFESDPYVTLYDDNYNVLENDDDNGEGLNFKLIYNLTAGETYYFAISDYGNEYSLSVKISKFENPIQNIEFQTAELLENINGWYEWDGDDEFFEYYYYDSLKYTVTFKDGTTTTKTGLSFEYDGTRIDMSPSDTQYEEHWQVGQTYDVTIKVHGIEYPAKVKVIANPISEIEFAPITVDCSGGYWSTYWDAEENETKFYRYSYNNKFTTYTITLKNGDTVTNNVEFDEEDYPYITFNDNKYYFDLYDTQYGEHWQVGGNYQIHVEVLGQYITTNASVISNHNWANATCTTDKTCINCKATVTGTKLAHNNITVPGSKATFTTNGSYSVRCTACGHTSYYLIAKIASVTTTEKVTYNKKVQLPAVTVKDINGSVLKNGVDYTVAYANTKSKNYGKYKITVTFKGNYSGSSVLYYEIVPKNTKISKLTAAKKSLKVKIKKKTKVSGYQIQYSLKKDFKSAKTLTLKKNSITSKTIKKLKAKKTYYVRVRTYKTVKGKKYYSAWSTAKKKKTK